MRDSHDSSPSSIMELHNRIQEQWEQIPSDYYQILVESIARRINAIL